MRPLPSECRYVAIEGVIGAGKTSLARLLARDTGGRLHLECVDENPFLPRFYAEPRRYALQTQIFFLLSRFRQQQELHQLDLFAAPVISDYIFAKDRIFANVTLDDEELRLYERLASELEPRVPVPDLVVYLQASVDAAMARIAKRGRAYEAQIARAYMEELNDAYNHFFFHYRDSPLLVVNTSAMDFVGNAEHYEVLRRHLAEPFQGVRYYTPAWEK